MSPNSFKLGQLSFLNHSLTTFFALNSSTGASSTTGVAPSCTASTGAPATSSTASTSGNGVVAFASTASGSGVTASSAA